MDNGTIDIITKLIFSIIVGFVIGGEREYRNKPAGLRTIVLICLGATIFTILSEHIGDDVGRSRIAANVVTGIGFLGAGAIMREGLSISGLTTASTIWVAAALGIAVGTGEYLLATWAVLFSFVVLTSFSYLEQHVFLRVEKTFNFEFSIDGSTKGTVQRIEEEMKTLKLKFEMRKHTRTQQENNYYYEVRGKERQIKAFSNFLSGLTDVNRFSY